MSKKKKPVKETTEEKTIEILGSTLKDGYCNYSMKVLKGPGAGTHNVKGEGLADEDLLEAIEAFNVHLAIIDDVFKHNKIDIKNCDKMINHELTANYIATGFKIVGSSDDESVILIGSKYVTCGGRICFETPKIPLNGSSSYEWYNELKVASDKAREEVHLYINGKCTAPEQESFDTNQMTIMDQIQDVEFENAKVE